MTRFRRRVAQAVAAIGLAVVLLLAALHVPAVQSRLVTAALVRLRTAAGIDVQVTDASFNVFTLLVRLRGVSASALTDASLPFLTADEVIVNLPRDVLFGRIALDELAITGLALDLVRDSEGALNIPSSGPESAEGPGGFSSLPIGRLRLRESNLSYRDLAQDWEVHLRGVDLSLARAAGDDATASGPLLVADGLSLRAGDVTSESTLLEGTIGYDGSSVSFDPLTYASTEGRVELRGGLDALWSSPRITLAASGTVALSELASTFGLDPSPRGTVVVQADVAGPLDAPVATLSLDSDGVSWRHIGPASLRATSTVTSSEVTLDSLTLGLDDGAVSGRARMATGDGVADIHADWDSLSAASLVGPLLPFSVSSRITGAADVAWTFADGLAGLTLTASNRSVAPAPTPGSDLVGVSGTMALDVADQKWSLRHEHAVNDSLQLRGNASGPLAADESIPTPLDGTLVVTSTDLGRAAAQFAALGVTVPDAARPGAGQLFAELRLGGTIASPTLRGEAAIADLTLAETGPLEVRSSIALDSRQLSIDRLEAAFADSEASATGTFAFESSAVSAAIDLRLADVSTIAAGVPEAWRPSGALEGRFDVEGSVAQPRVRGRIESPGLTAGGQSMASLSVEVEYDAGTIDVRQLQIEQALGGRLTLDADYALDTGTYGVSAAASGFAIQPLGALEAPWPLSAVVDGRFDGRGTLEQPAGTARLTITDLRWEQIILGPADLDVDVSDGTVLVNGRFADLATTAMASLALQEPRAFEVVVSADGTPVARLTRELRRTQTVDALDGVFSAVVEARGTLANLAATTVAAELGELDLSLGTASLRLAAPATVRYAEGAVDVEGLRLLSGGTVLEASGHVGTNESLQRLTASLDGTLDDLDPWLDVLGVAADMDLTDLGGRAAIELTAAGPLDRPTIAGTALVENGAFRVADYPAVDGILLDAAFDNDALDIAAIRAAWSGTVLEARARLPLALAADWLPEALLAAAPPDGSNASLVGTINGITPAVLAPFADADRLTALDGAASLSFDLQADNVGIERVQGTVTLDEFDAVVAGTSLTQLRPTQLIMANGQLHVADWTWAANGNLFTVAGEAELDDDFSLDLRGVGRIDLRTLGAFLPSGSSSGTAIVSVDLLGSVAEPVIEGTVELQAGELLLTDPVLAVSDLTGRVVLEGRRLRTDNVRGTLNGGPFTADGEIEHEGLTIIDGSLTVTGSGIALNVPEGLRTEVETELTLAFEPRRRISGRVTVLQGAFRQPLSLASGVLATLRQRATVRPARGAAPVSEGFGLTELDIVIANSEDVIVDNNYGRMELAFDVRLVGTIDQPSVVGRAEIREGGTLFLGGRTYQIDTGTIDLTNTREIVPELNLTARTRISGIDITLIVSGTPQTVRADLSSNPPHSQTDIVSLLATGRLSDQLGGSSTQVAGGQLLGYLSGEALGFAAQAIGVDTLRLEQDVQFDDFRTDPSLLAGETNPTSRLTVSRGFTQYIDVVFSRNLSEGGQTWIVNYTPRRAFEFRFVSFDDRSRAYEARHNITFGGGSSIAGRGTSVPRRPEPQIAGVRLLETTTVSTEELERLLRLNVGDRFDFFRWQQDRERLRAFYVERGYLEARVGARHIDRSSASGEPETILEYDIDQGPLARLVVNGHDLPARVRDDLEEAWSNAVFDEARLADLRRLVRLHLAEDGFLLATVDAALDGSEGATDDPGDRPGDDTEKRIVLMVTPGPHTTSHAVTFEGRQDVLRDELEALAAPAQLGLEAWLQPRLLAEAVADLHRQRGFLAVEVDAGPIAIDGQRATLPVRITEGPAFPITEIVVEGATARSESDVLGAFGIAPGSRYRRDEVERARRAVEASYASDGFNAVRASTISEVDLAAATVRVTLGLEEGPRQVLERVTIEGDAVNRNAVTTALRLESGTAVDMNNWFEARRRVLDTGLFRRVEIAAVPIDVDAPASQTQPVEARINLERWPSWQLRYGLDITDEAAPTSETSSRRFGAGVTADLQRRGLFGRAASIGTSGRFNQNIQIGRLFLTMPSLFGLSIPTSFFASRSRENVQEDDFFAVVTDRTAFTVEQRVGRPSAAQLSYSYQVERNHTFFRNDPEDFIPATTAARLSSSLVLDRRDDQFNATVGLFHSSTVEYAPTILGSDVRFVKYFGQQFYYRSFGRDIVSASAFRLGAGRGFEQDLLLSERFFAGGANSVRGYGEGALGPRDFFGDAAGGDSQLVLNQEIRFPIAGFLRGVGFADAGNIYERASDLSFTDLAVGVGAGLRISTPIGLFRLDLGVPLSRDDGDRTPRWHFAFGQMF